MNIDLEKYNDRGQFKVPEGYYDTLRLRSRRSRRSQQRLYPSIPGLKLLLLQQ